MAQPLPVLILHPAPDPRPHRLCPGQRRGQPVGEPVVMVVARDRYPAEDAARDPGRLRSPARRRGVEAARSASVLVHDDAPGNVAAHLVQEVGDVEAALAAAPHTLTIP